MNPDEHRGIERLSRLAPLEADHRALDVMVKNDRLYKDTGGWGFDHFDRDSTTGSLPARGRATCFECHTRATRDLVSSTIRK